MSLKQVGSHLSPHRQGISCDPAATLCVFLIAKRGWSHTRIAHTLGVPQLVVEECIRNGVSSASLRAQLAHWVVECNDEALPPALVQAVVEAAVTELSGDGVGCMQDEDPLASVDPITRAYFLELNSSIGHSFIPIANDPRESGDDSKWGSWLGSIVLGAFDYTGQTKRADASAGSESLLTSYNMQEDYSSYLKLLSSPYTMNRKDGKLRSDVVASSSLDSQNRCSSHSFPLSETLPWPADIPKEFFKPSYSPRCEIEFLEKMQGCGNASTGTGEASNIVNAETFGDDFEMIESRMRELRKWEGAVEECLLQHVQSRSEEFFLVSREFGDRASEARETFEDLQRTRVDVGVFGKSLVREMMIIARCYRARNNLVALRTLLESVIVVSSQVASAENWVALPERDMMELPVVVEGFRALQEVIQADNRTEASVTDPDSVEAGFMVRVAALKDVLQRVAHLRERLCSMIMCEMEMVLVPSAKVGVIDGQSARIFFSAVGMGMWPDVVQQCREVVIYALWTTVRETFIASMMNSSSLSDHTANDILLTAVGVDSPREEKLALFAHSNTCRFSTYMQVVGAVVDKTIDFVRQAAQRWGSLLIESELHPESCSGLVEDVEEVTRKYFSSLCAVAEGVLSLLLEVRSYNGRTPTNVHELEAIVSMASAFLPNMLSNFQGVAAICGSIGDPWRFVSGKQLKYAVTRLTKEHFRCYHAACVEKLRITIDGETWQSEEIDAAFQACVDTICRSDDVAIAELQAHALFVDVTKSGESHQPVPRATTSVKAAAVMAPVHLDTSETGARKLLLLPSVDNHVEGRVVSRSLLLLTELLHQYDYYLGRFSFLAFEVVGKICDLLKLYNSHCAALLLGAMAVKNGSLKTITLQHMAVASQNMAFLYDSIPLMQRRWIRATNAEKLLLSLSDDVERVRKDCATYRNELFGKISTLVKEKVDGLGTFSAEQWGTSGNEWVMTMLRETARLMRVLKPLLSPTDSRGVVVPLLGTFARMIRSVTASPGMDADLRAVILSDILLFKANVERFGFDVLQCAALYRSPVEAMMNSLEPCSSEGSVLRWFFDGEEAL